jgi:hypothetical protein
MTQRNVRDILRIRSGADARVMLVVNRFVARDHRFRRKLAGAKPEKWAKGIAALNWMIVRLAAGEDVSPKVRRLLVRALSSGELQLVPERSKGRPLTAERDVWIRGLVKRQLRKSRKREDAYRVVGERIGLSQRRIEQIAQRRKTKTNRD